MTEFYLHFLLIRAKLLKTHFFMNDRNMTDMKMYYTEIETECRSMTFSSVMDFFLNSKPLFAMNIGFNPFGFLDF